MKFSYPVDAKSSFIKCFFWPHQEEHTLCGKKAIKAPPTRATLPSKTYHPRVTPSWNEIPTYPSKRFLGHKRKTEFHVFLQSSTVANYVNKSNISISS